jgi:hypothetical protein
MTRDTWATIARSARQLGLDCEALHARVAAFLADQARAPLPPDVLASALQDRIHETSGKLISAKPLKHLAPTPSPQTEQPPPLPPSVESSQPADAAVTGRVLPALPAGWGEHCDYAAGCFQHDGGDACVQGDGKHPDTWWWQTGPGAAVKHAPTMLQAMCAALGLKLSRMRGRFACLDDRCWESLADSLAFDDIESCAADALERFHARQQKPATPSIAERNAITVGEMLGLRRLEDATTQPDPHPCCKCWTVGVSDGTTHRSVNRWCSIPAHAAEWQTLAEQGSPELNDWGLGGRLDEAPNGR